ncbi:MAG: hypothetical protein HWD59_05130 [Coxiellaceae bacterium]|nr:MAG: hypothetical protein HWD59_05130 [Coxiellaceae bacterium]
MFEADKSKAFAAELALKVTDKPIEKLKLLAKRVDFQAYALVIAVAYIHHKQISVEEYLNLFDAHMHTSRKTGLSPSACK